VRARRDLEYFNSPRPQRTMQGNEEVVGGEKPHDASERGSLAAAGQSACRPRGHEPAQHEYTQQDRKVDAAGAGEQCAFAPAPVVHAGAQPHHPDDEQRVPAVSQSRGVMRVKIYARVVEAFRGAARLKSWPSGRVDECVEVALHLGHRRRMHVHHVAGLVVLHLDARAQPGRQTRCAMTYSVAENGVARS